MYAENQRTKTILFFDGCGNQFDPYVLDQIVPKHFHPFIIKSGNGNITTDQPNENGANEKLKTV